jgi:SnoaL-like domain
MSSDDSDYLGVRRLQDAYADVVTRRAWPELAELFLPEAVVEVDTRTNEPLRFEGPKALGDFIGGAIERFAFFEFVILNSIVHLNVGDDFDRAAARMYMCELRTDRETGEWINAFGVYHDRYRRRDDRWWFEHRQYSSLGRDAEDGTHRMEAFEFPHHLTLD